MYLNVSGRATVSRCLTFIPISCMGPKHGTNDTYLIFLTNLYALEHVRVVQIWIMHINALKTQLMHKNVQTNPEKSQKMTQHSCCSMLTREKKLKAIRGNGYPVLSPKVGRSLPKQSCLLWEALVCEKLIPKPAPNGTKILPRHVDAAPW